MRIEKISDIQIKVLLNEEDLAEHDIKLTELVYGSEKTQTLFHYMMEQAEEQYGFEAANTPLIVEAMPMDLNGLTIVITKVQGLQKLEEVFTHLPFAKLGGRFKTREALDADSPKEKSQDTLIYSFANMDDMILACSRANPYFFGNSAAYKYDGKYFLVLTNVHNEETGSMTVDMDLEGMEAMLAEYGNRHTANHLSKYYMQDHGEELIKENAVEILATL